MSLLFQCREEPHSRCPFRRTGRFAGSGLIFLLPGCSAAQKTPQKEDRQTDSRGRGGDDGGFGDVGCDGGVVAVEAVVQQRIQEPPNAPILSRMYRRAQI